MQECVCAYVFVCACVCVCVNTLNNNVYSIARSSINFIRPRGNNVSMGAGIIARKKAKKCTGSYKVSAI